MDPSAGGWTPLRNVAYQLAQRSGTVANVEAGKQFLECAELLLAHGASTTLKTPGYNGKTAREWGRQNTAFIEILDQHRHSPKSKPQVEAGAPSEMQDSLARTIFKQIVQNKFEQRNATGDHHDEVRGLLPCSEVILVGCSTHLVLFMNLSCKQVVAFLSGAQGKGKGMEVSYTKEQQKTANVQSNKDQDSDVMEVACTSIFRTPNTCC